MYIVVTGAAGFVGANIVRGLNARGETDIIAVDNLTRADKFRNLVDCEIADYLDKDEFLVRLAAGDFDDDVAAILHQGACSDTMETDGRYMMRNNYRYSVHAARPLPEQRHSVPVRVERVRVRRGHDVRRTARARSAAQRVRLLEVPVRPVRAAHAAGAHGAHRRLSLLQRVWAARTTQGHGWRRSPFTSSTNTGRAGHVRLFDGSGGYAAGEQRRDFVFVDDVVAVNLDFLDRPETAPASSTGVRPRANLQRRGGGNDQRVPRRRRTAAVVAGRARACGRDRIRRVSATARRQIPELHAGRSFGVCAPPGIGRR